MYITGGEESSLSEYEPLAKRARKKPPLQPPTDDEIRIYLMEILENANLEHVSMNMIILQVYAHYSGFNLESRKDLIKAIVLSLINTWINWSLGHTVLSPNFKWM